MYTFSKGLWKNRECMCVLQGKWPRHPLLFWGYKPLRRFHEIHKPKDLVWMWGKTGRRRAVVPLGKRGPHYCSFIINQSIQQGVGTMNEMHLESMALSGGGDIERCLVPPPHSTICHCSVAPIIKRHELPGKSTLAYTDSVTYFNPRGFQCFGPREKGKWTHAALRRHQDWGAYPGPWGIRFEGR